MARYKRIDTNPKFIAVDLASQLLPGTFEHALNHLFEHEVDLSGLDARYSNDETGAPAYPPAVLLKLILFAYSRGIVSSRAIERAGREHVTFIALSGDSAPHFTTIAGFIRALGDEIAHLFAQVLFICDAQGLIGREMFAIDGVKLPSNASKQRSGTRAEFERQAAKLEAQAAKMPARHRANDERETEPDLAEKNQRRSEKLHRGAAQIRRWLKDHPQDRLGSKGAIRKSNRTDNDSAKMATDKGVIQGYTAVAAVDAQAQVIVEAQAHGTGSEQALLLPMVEGFADLRDDHSLVTADAGYHSEENLKALAETSVAALIADRGMRQRDERFAEQAKYTNQPDPLYDKTAAEKKATLYGPQDFKFDPATKTCICPAGKRLYRHGNNCTINGYAAIKFQGAQRDCVPCSHRRRCLRHPEKTKTRQVAFFQGRRAESYTERMKRAIDSPRGRRLYGQRIGIVEPVFANLRHNKKLDRFTLRGRAKVDTQWKLYCLVHNIEKLAHHGYAQ
ncbi:IS1182 family transposase [Betaproteobacteria bacterium PRO7]|nr:IS1182 family transposase [Betaproteobacteria bacterium PRO7]